MIMENRQYTVSEINSLIKENFDCDARLKAVYVKGEVSNCKYHTSGHIYFTLKDKASQISCVMFAGRKKTGLSFDMKNGQSVVVFGSISVYEAGGSYQIYADIITPEGLGLLYEEFERLKKQLGEEGLFDVSKKKPIPKYVSKVGIVTASTGAAIRDICQISHRRNPYVSLILYPALVQGKDAADSIVKGIRALDGKVDVIIVGRGGGSIEDLWAFNEEKTARAIFACNTPIISAVGHETDTTISDYVSDLRAPTPSAAAELAVYDYNTLQMDLGQRQDRLHELMAGKIDSYKSYLTNAETRLRKNSPAHQLEMKKQRIENGAVMLKRYMDDILNSRKQKLDGIAPRLRMDIENILNTQKQKTVNIAPRLRMQLDRILDSRKQWLENAAPRIRRDMDNILIERKSEMKATAAKLEAVNPVKRLNSGFSYVADNEGKNIKSIASVNKGDKLIIHVTDGEIHTSVNEVKENYGRQ